MKEFKINWKLSKRKMKLCLAFEILDFIYTKYLAFKILRWFLDTAICPINSISKTFQQQEST